MFQYILEMKSSKLEFIHHGELSWNKRVLPVPTKTTWMNSPLDGMMFIHYQGINQVPHIFEDMFSSVHLSIIYSYVYNRWLSYYDLHMLAQNETPNH